MKRTVLVFAVLFGCVLASAQQPLDKQCRKLQSQVDSIAAKGDYDKAFSMWADLRKKCASSEKVYTSGIELFKIKADRANPEDRQTLAKQLLQLYDDYVKNIPNPAAPVSLYKAMAMDRYGIGSDEDRYKLLDYAYSKNPAAFNDVSAIYRYLELYFGRYKSGDKTVTVAKLLQKRDELAAHVERLSAESPANASNNARVLDSMNRLLTEIATCENLDAFYGPSFEKRSKETAWLSTAFRSFSAADCRSSKVFAQIVEAQQNIEPTAQSAYSLGASAYQNANMDEAARYFIQSAELTVDPLEKANTYFTIASTVYAGRDKAKQKEFAQKALLAKPDFSKSYILLAQLYADASPDCAKSEFEKKALNWLAAETLRKAIAIDKNRGSLDRLVKKYEEKAPSAKEIKDSKMAGQTIAYGCWINESVIVPGK